MQPEMIRQGLTLLEPRDHPSPIDFQVAYQTRIALDRIKFAIKHIERLANARNWCVRSVCSCWTLSIGLMSWTTTFRPDLDCSIEKCEWDGGRSMGEFSAVVADGFSLDALLERVAEKLDLRWNLPAGSASYAENRRLPGVRRFGNQALT